MRHASDIEIAKSLKTVRAVCDSDEQFESIEGILSEGRDRRRISNIIRGLNEEDEFALLSRLMDTSTHLVRLEQTPIGNADYIAPDFIARFTPGCSICQIPRDPNRSIKCFVEVKSTDKRSLKISAKDVRRRVAFARAFGFPLFLAVRFLEYSENAAWHVVDISEQGDDAVRVRIEDLNHGLRHVLWDEYACLIHDDVYFENVFDPSYDGLGVVHKEFGRQRALHLHKGGDSFPLRGVDAMTFAYFFEAFDPHVVDETKVGGLVKQITRPTLKMAMLADFIFKLNSLPTDLEGRPVYDPPRVLARLDGTDTPSFLTRDFIHGLAEMLFRSGILMKVGFGTEGSHLSDWQRYCEVG